MAVVTKNKQTYNSDKYTTVTILEFQLVLVERIQIFKPPFSVRCPVSSVRLQYPLKDKTLNNKLLRYRIFGSHCTRRM